MEKVCPALRHGWPAIGARLAETLGGAVQTAVKSIIPVGPDVRIVVQLGVGQEGISLKGGEMGKQNRTVSVENGSLEKVAARVWRSGRWDDWLVYKHISRQGQRVRYLCPVCYSNHNRKPILHRLRKMDNQAEKAAVSLGFDGSVVVHKPAASEQARPTHWCWKCGKFFRVLNTSLGPVEDMNEEALFSVHV